MDGLTLRYPLIELVGIFNGTVFHTDGVQPVHLLSSTYLGFFDHRNSEIPRFPLYALHLGMGDHLDIGMSLALSTNFGI